MCVTGANESGCYSIQVRATQKSVGVCVGGGDADSLVTTTKIKCFLFCFFKQHSHTLNVLLSLFFSSNINVQKAWTNTAVNLDARRVSIFWGVLNISFFFLMFLSLRVSLLSCSKKGEQKKNIYFTKEFQHICIYFSPLCTDLFPEVRKTLKRSFFLGTTS